MQWWNNVAQTTAATGHDGRDRGLPVTKGATCTTQVHSDCMVVFVCYILIKLFTIQYNAIFDTITKTSIVALVIVALVMVACNPPLLRLRHHRIVTALSVPRTVLESF